MSQIKQQLQNDMKQAMKARDQKTLTTIRLVIAAIKQKEIDDRVELDDAAVLLILEKLVKQRKDAITQYQAAGRDELAQKEADELSLIQQYLPEQLSEDEVDQVVREVIDSVGAQSIKEMGKVMAEIKPRLQGRADMSLVSAKVKTCLSS